MGEELRIGCYICHCGLNIAGVINVEKVAEATGKLPGVVISKHYVYMCSEPGQEMIKKDIKDHNLNRVVVASCSPQMHEPTFRSVVEEAGVNRYLFEMANLREQCSWAHSNNPVKATEKAKDILRMAVAKARLLQPLEKREVQVKPTTLVVGGGITGIQAALELANRGFSTYLVEKAPYLGGRVIQLNRVFLTNEKASDILNPMINALTSNPNIEVFTNTEIEEITGYIGNFEAKLKRKPRFVNKKCNLCGKCIEVCPVEVPDEFNFGLNNRKAIYIPHKNATPNIPIIDEANCTRCGECVKVCKQNAILLDSKPENEEISVGTIIVATGYDPYLPVEEYGFREYEDVITQFQLERILSSNGPTNGRLIQPSNGKVPNNVVFVLCVGSRAPDRPYCSRVCCSVALKNAMLIKEEYPDTQVFILYRDIRSFSKGQEELYGDARMKGINFFKYLADKPPKISKPDNSQIQVQVFDPTLGMTVEIPTDLLVLVEAITPRKDATELGSKIGVTRTPDGFFREAHPKLKPLDTNSDGIYLAGVAQFPKDITECIVQAWGAAARVAIPMSKGRVDVEPIVASVNEDLCIECGTCESICPYGAIKKGEKGKAEVTEILCKGCGSCAASCPARAITIFHFTDEQILAQSLAVIGRENREL
ncbi:MAG: 4Fe-4S binding protein [Candidatus Jordarchaeum sp.]|uniref:4Fe-4S binding protein n=1 Tax=Candidatus Jordarchaeum sp. TaxID=2823881 RepID=UPI00404B6A0C